MTWRSAFEKIFANKWSVTELAKKVTLLMLLLWEKSCVICFHIWNSIISHVLKIITTNVGFCYLSNAFSIGKFIAICFYIWNVIISQYYKGFQQMMDFKRLNHQCFYMEKIRTYLFYTQNEIISRVDIFKELTWI